jgi:hypothetical protein
MPLHRSVNRDRRTAKADVPGTTAPRPQNPCKYKQYNNLIGAIGRDPREQTPLSLTLVERILLVIGVPERPAGGLPSEEVGDERGGDGAGALDVVEL